MQWPRYLTVYEVLGTEGRDGAAERCRWERDAEGDGSDEEERAHARTEQRATAAEAREQRAAAAVAVAEAEAAAAGVGTEQMALDRSVTRREGAASMLGAVCMGAAAARVLRHGGVSGHGQGGRTSVAGTPVRPARAQADEPVTAAAARTSQHECEEAERQRRSERRWRQSRQRRTRRTPLGNGRWGRWRP